MLREQKQKDLTIRSLLLPYVLTCIRHHYAHLQQNKDPVTALWCIFVCFLDVVLALVGRRLVGCEHYEVPQPLPTIYKKPNIHQMQ